MAKKSKTQKAKASAARAQKKAAQEKEELVVEEVETEEVEEPKKGLLKKSKKTETPVETKKDKKQEKQVAKKEEKKPEKKQRFKFIREVRQELKRVTWPTRKDVIRWSGVVVAALLFFGIYVAVLDNLIVGPLLVAISGLGA